MLRARVGRDVDAVAEAGELVLRRKASLDECLDPVGRADLVEHLHRPVGRAPVERSLERAHRGRDRGVHVRERRRGDPRRERRRVEAVLGLEDEACVEDLRGARMREPGHLREARGMSKRRVRRNRLLPPTAPDIRRQDRRELRREADRFAVLGLARVVALRGVLRRRRRDDRPQHVHGRAALGHLLEDLPEERRDGPVLRELRLEVPELLFARQIAVQEEVGDLLVFGLACQLVDRVTAVLELAVLDRTDGRGGRDDSLKAPRRRLGALHRHVPSVAYRCLAPSSGTSRPLAPSLRAAYSPPRTVRHT